MRWTGTGRPSGVAKTKSNTKLSSFLSNSVCVHSHSVQNKKAISKKHEGGHNSDTKIRTNNSVKV